MATPESEGAHLAVCDNLYHRGIPCVTVAGPQHCERVPEQCMACMHVVQNLAQLMQCGSVAAAWQELRI